MGKCKMGFSEKEVFRMTLNKFYKLYNQYKIYYDFEIKKGTYQDLEKKQQEDEEWLP